MSEQPYQPSIQHPTDPNNSTEFKNQNIENIKRISNANQILILFLFSVRDLIFYSFTMNRLRLHLNFPLQYNIFFSKMENLFVFQKKGAEEPQKDSIKEIELEYVSRRQKRESEFQKIKKEIEDDMEGTQRKTQNTVLYFINLSILIIESIIQAFSMLDASVNTEQKAVLMFIFVIVGLISSIVSNLLIINWREVLKMYLLLDSTIPVVIAASIGFFAIYNFSSTGVWYQILYSIAYPIWIVYLGGSLRVMIKHVKWSRWEIVLYKLVLLFSGLILFYVGFEYMNGKYKISSGYLIQLESRFKDMVLLYVFGIVELFFEYYRRLSYFDQTEDLKFEFLFQDESQVQQKRMVKAELKVMELEMLKQNLRDQLKHKQRASLVSSSSKSNSDIPSARQ